MGDKEVTARELSAHFVKLFKSLRDGASEQANDPCDQFTHGFRTGCWSTYTTLIGLLELFEATGGLPKLTSCDPTEIFKGDSDANQFERNGPQQVSRTN